MHSKVSPREDYLLELIMQFYSWHAEILRAFKNHPVSSDRNDFKKEKERKQKEKKTTNQTTWTDNELIKTKPIRTTGLGGGA